MDPTPERFHRLARSAPYRWSRLVLEGTWGPHVAPVRVLVVQPDHVRVERLDGTAVSEVRQGSVSGAGDMLTSDGRHVPYVPPLPRPPEVDGDGLVTTVRRPVAGRPGGPVLAGLPVRGGP